MKWRVLNITCTQALLLIDRMPDTYPFHDNDEDTTWSQSDLRQWLNSVFLTRAFSDAELQNKKVGIRQKNNLKRRPIFAKLLVTLH